MRKRLKAINHYNPGDPGTKQLQKVYGDRLVCVRNRYDEERGMKVKTVEIIVEEKPWRPPFKFRDSDIVPLHVSFEELELREKLKECGGRWDPLSKTWLVQYWLVRENGWEAKISREFIDSKKRNGNK